MNIFISWSGKDSRSHRTALLLKDWLPKVVQKVSCFVSSHDIDAGARWAGELFAQLEQCNMGILCLTPDCLGKPWLLFEAGALAKKVENSRVCPLLIDLAPSDVGYPLAAFQLKGTDKEGMRGIVEMVNKSRGADALSDGDLEEAFETRWPQFTASFEKLPASLEQKPKKETDSKVQKTLDEVLALVRGLANNQAPAPPVRYVWGTSASTARRSTKDFDMPEISAEENRLLMLALPESLEMEKKEPKYWLI